MMTMLVEDGRNGILFDMTALRVILKFNVNRVFLLKYDQPSYEEREFLSP